MANEHQDYVRLKLTLRKLELARTALARRGMALLTSDAECARLKAEWKEAQAARLAAEREERRRADAYRARVNDLQQADAIWARLEAEFRAIQQEKQTALDT